MKKIAQMSKRELQRLANESDSIRQMLENAGYSRNSGSMQQRLSERIKLEGIDVSHFSAQLAKRRARSIAKYTLAEILIKDSPYTNISRLKMRLIESGLLAYRCRDCGNKGRWKGLPLSLQLEHIDGDCRDHSLENLCFLCPNCHSQTDTYAGKNRGKYKS